MINLPTPDSAILWFLQNVVGIPAIILLPFWILLSVMSWISFGRSANSWAETVLIGFRSRTSATTRAFWSMIVVQALLVPVTYLVVQMYQTMRGEGPWAGLRLDESFDLNVMIRAALAYNHWTPFTLDVVKLTVTFIIAVNLLALVTNGIQRVFIVLVVPPLGFAAIVAIAGLAVMGNTLMGDSQSSFTIAQYYLFWVVVLVLWSALLTLTCTTPTNLKNLTRKAAESQG